MRQRILIIDDDTYICKLLSNFLKKHDFETEIAYTGSSALEKIRKEQFHLVLSDYRLPDRDGFEILYATKERDPDLPVIIMTAYEELATAVRLIKAGANDYITKPLIPEEMLEIVKEALNDEKNEKLPVSFEEDFISGESEKFREILDHIRIVSPVDITVIIQGETGSGKEYVARAIHHNSKRNRGPFIAVDCGALPKGVVNSELFGHVKGSFTGATYDKTGLFEQASDGTLFLDEISNLDAENQMKLLRVLQEKKITRVGDTKSISVDVRLLIASNEDLMEEVAKNNMREDLYHRLNEFKVNVPPLRERGDDVLVFTEAFIARASRRFNKQVTGYDKEVEEILLNYPWPGNIRELKNLITRSVLLTKSNKISLRDIPEEVRAGQALYQINDSGSEMSAGNLKNVAEMAEKKAIIQALIKSNYNKSRAARLLKIDRKTLYNKIKQFNISLVEPK